jgi:ATP-dependent DNA ligase
VPSGQRWVHEIKFDGYRVQLHISNGAVKIFNSAWQRLDQAFPQDCGRCLAH